MKRCRIYLEIFTVALYLGLLAGCSEKNLDSPAEPVADPSVLLNAGEMPFRLGFNLVGEKASPKSKASIVGGDEDTGDFVKTITMLCFTKEGIYLGYRRGDLVGTEHQFTSGHTNCYGRDLFTGSIPANTTRIHFLANAEGHIPGFDKTGTLENVLMRNVLVTSGLDDRRVIYWGFHKEETTAAMKDWLSKMVVTEDPITGKKDTTYVKRDGSLVHLIRDRARIKLGTMTDDPEDPDNPSGNDYRILQIDWLLSNGLNRGFIAPYKASAADHYAGYIDDTTLEIDENRHSPYNLSDAARYTADDENQMVTVCKWENGHHTFYHDDITRMLFLFEDQNNANNPPKLILRVKYQKHYDRTDEADQVTKYHTLMLLDKDNQPLKVLRNHSFVVNIHSMPWKGIGHLTFAEAVNTTEYENNRTVTIDDNVDDITDGKYELSIKDGTSRIYRTGTGTVQTINFEFKPTDAAQGSTEWHSLMDTVTKKGFKVNWEEIPDASFAANDVKVATWNNASGQGTITFTLGTTINAALQSGVIDIQNIQTGLTRRIHIYTITNFSFLPEGSTSITLERDGSNYRTISGKTCNTYKLTLRIPGNYPAGLYPIRVRMASSTLNPFKYEVNGVEDDNIYVETSGTENGDIVDGESLAGMTYVTTANKWNTRATGSPWNYWYFFDIISKPTTTDSGGQTVEDMSDKLYTVYFDDTRPLRAAANQADGVGLFLKIKYFGDAQSAYVIAAP